MTNSQAGAAQTVDDSEYLNDQVVMAKDSLGEALGMVQDLTDTKLNLDDITASLAGSVRSLFAAQNSGLSDNSHIDEAMNYLRSILQQMQDVLDAEPQLEHVAGTVAKILAILFPVFKALPNPEKQNISLTQQKKIEQNKTDEQAKKPRDFQFQPPSSEVSERRTSSRVAIEVDIGFASDSNFFTGFSMDISSGGLFVATYDMPVLGTPVNLSFKLPKGPVLSIDGIVKWTREFNETTPDVAPGVGVQFENISKKDANTINKYMSDAPPLFYDEF